MKKYIQLLVLPVLLLTLVVPNAAFAQTTYQSAAVQQQIAYLYSLVAQLQAQLLALQTAGQTNSVTSYLTIQTDGVSEASNDSVELDGRVVFVRDGDARVWFEYGVSTALNYSTESRDVNNGDKGDTISFSAIVPDLNTNQIYYYRAVAEGDDGRYAEGSIKSFKYTGDYSNNNNNNSNNDDTPDATTDDVDDVDESSAELNGDVDMNDFEDGLAFFVYGEDESDVEDVADEDTYGAIDENGNDLQKVLLSSGLDDDRSFTADIFGLDDNTEYFYRICVEYEDEDNDETLSCGDVENFETENN
jgi:hypothetical protein